MMVISQVQICLKSVQACFEVCNKFMTAKSTIQEDGQPNTLNVVSKLVVMISCCDLFNYN